MKPPLLRQSPQPAPSRLRGRSPFGARKACEIAELRARLAEAEETLRAIRNGEVDAVMVAGKNGPQVYTLEGADRAYRLLIERMNEGALILTSYKMILYANQRFAKMVKCPLERLIGSSFGRFLSAKDRATIRPLMKQGKKSGFRIRAFLHAGDGSQLPALISSRPLEKKGSNGATFGIVVTDMTEARHNEEMLRTLTHRLMQAQEAERGRVALELHDNITQLICAVLVRCEALVKTIPARAGRLKREAITLREMLGQTAQDVERISRNLRPSVLDELGLVAALKGLSTEFAQRTSVPVKLACFHLTARLSAEVEGALFRIVQKALNNVERHAGARHVAVRLEQRPSFVQLTIRDDGVGFDPGHPPEGNETARLGLLGMHERAVHVGGAFKIKSDRRAGTEIEIRIPLPPGAVAAH